MSSAADKFAHVKALRPVKPARRATDDLPFEADRLAELAGATCERNRYGEYLVVRRWYPEPEACAAAPDAIRLLAPDAPAAAADPGEWLFLDTETSGLAGGTGTYAFLVGVAWWDTGGLQVEQFFMRDYSEEHSLLLALAERMAERRVLVTYNGKSFDWPLLETRYRMTRQIQPRAPQAHLDLLHPARHLWRLRLGSVRLSELERHILAAGSALPWSRDDDVPGQLIPQLYFDYLRGGPAEPLAGVFRHNQMDLRGLAGVAGRILALVEQPEAAEGDALELYGLSKLLHRRGEHGRARLLYERALAAGLSGAVSRAARRELAALAKRERDYARAVELWQGLAGAVRATPGSPAGGASPAPTNLDETPGMDSLEAYEQLAIYYEHHAREPDRAEELTRDALRELRQGFRIGAVEPGRYRKLKARLEHRLARLARKSARDTPRIGRLMARGAADGVGVE